MASMMIFNMSFGAIFAESRNPDDREKKRIEDAVDVLKEMGDEEWAEDVEKWIEDGKIKIDPDITQRATTKKDGTITLRADLVREPTDEQKSDDIKKWALDAELARVLVHEKKHAHYQAPNSETFEANGIKASDWDEVYEAFEICTGPEATEVEAYYTFLHMLCEWWGKLEAKNTEEADKKQIEVFMMIWRWVKNLKDFDYEKEDYISDFFDERDKKKKKPTKETIGELKEELERRIGGMYDEGGPYDRARKAAEEAKKAKEEAESSILEDAYEFFKDLIGMVISVEPQYIDDFEGIEVALYDPYIESPPGFEYVDFSGIDAPLMGLQYIGEYQMEIPFNITLTTENTNDSNMALFQVVYSKPSSWRYVDEQSVNTETAQIEAVVEGSGFYAILQPEPLFEDVSVNSPYYSYIHWMEERKIMVGTGNKVFGYGKPLTRGQYCALVVRAMKLKGSDVNGFKDVKKSDWYNGPISAAYEKGLIKGESKDKFSPNKGITREQAMILMVRASGYEEEALGLNEEEVEMYLDSIIDKDEISSWARKYVAQALRLGMLVAEQEEGDMLSFKPGQAVKREEASKLIYLMMMMLGINTPLS